MPEKTKAKGGLGKRREASFRGPLLDIFLIDMRSYRDSTWNKGGDRGDSFILGATQLTWLKRELASSNATWKVIAADLPIGIVSTDAIALGDGPPARREVAMYRLSAPPLECQFKTFAAAALLSCVAVTPVFAQAAIQEPVWRKADIK